MANAAPRAADTVLRNGYVYTVDDNNSVKQALAIRDGVIVYAGSNRGVRKFIGAGTRVTNLGGRMVMPGMIDGHTHDIVDPEQASCDLGGGSLSVTEFRSMVQDCLDDPNLHTGTPGAPDDFLIVDGFYAQFLTPKGTPLTKDLFPPTSRPIFSNFAVTTHGGLVNQAALDLAGITASTPDPPGGWIGHDENGDPNGFLADFPASNLVARFIPEPPPLTEERRLDLVESRMKTFTEKGITGFYIPGSRLAPDFQALRQQHRLNVRAHFGASATNLPGRPDYTTPEGRDAYFDGIEQNRAFIEKLGQLSWQQYRWRPGAKREGPKVVPEPGVAIPGVKLLDDGLLQYPQQTAAVLEPYLDENGDPRTDSKAYGSLAIESDALDPLVKGLIKRGFQPHVHDIGDRAARTTLDAYEKAQRWNPRLEWASRPVIAHAELVDPADIPRFAELNVTASMGLQWAKPAPDSTWAVKPYLGEPRWNYYEPSGWITNAGGRVSQGSDCCLDPFKPFFGLEVTILREADWGPEFPEFAGKLNNAPGLSFANAMRVMTINGAYQLFQDEVLGSLEKGKIADLLVLDQNIAKIPTDDISETNPLMTMVGGKRVWVDPDMRAKWGGEENFASKPPARKAGLGLTVSPKKANTRANGKVTFRAKVTSTGTGQANGVKVCLRAPKKAVKGSRCAGVGKLAPGSTRTVRFRVRPAAKAKAGATYTLRFKATGKGARPASQKAKLKVRR